VVQMTEERPEAQELEADVIAPPMDIVKRTLFHGGVLSAFRNRDYTLLLSGAFVSNIGTWIHNTVLLWYVKDTYGSNASVAAVNLANFLPVLLFVIIAGSLADNLNRKKIIIMTQAVMMLAALALAICTQAGVASLPVILVITAVMGVAFTFTFPATRSIIPDLVPRADMQNAIALDAAQFNMTRCIGPAIAALIFSAWGVQAAFYINAASFMAVILALLAVRTRTPGLPPPPGGRARHVREGMRYAWGHKWSRNLLIVLGIFSFSGTSFIVLLPGITKDVLHKGNVGYGFLLGFVGMGAVIGGPLVTLLGRYIKEREIIKYSTLGYGLLMLLVSFCRTYWVCVLLALGLGITVLMMSATVNTVLQSRVEREMRGRIMSFYIMVFQGVLPVGGLAMGFLSDRTSLPFTVFIGGITCACLGAVIILVPSILREAAFAVLPQEGPFKG